MRIAIDRDRENVMKALLLILLVSLPALGCSENSDCKDGYFCSTAGNPYGGLCKELSEEALLLEHRQQTVVQAQSQPLSPQSQIIVIERPSSYYGPSQLTQSLERMSDQNLANFNRQMDQTRQNLQQIQNNYQQQRTQSAIQQQGWYRAR